MSQYKVPSFLRRDGDSLLFNEDGQFIFYIPEIYFDRKDAFIVGEFVNLIGVLDYAIYSKSGTTRGIKRFYFPSIFLCKPARIERQRAVSLKPGVQPQDYRLLIFNKDDAVVVSTKVPENIKNVEDFYEIFISGKLPTTIPYDKLQDYFPESIKLNGSSYGMSLQMFGFIIGEMCRDQKDLHKAFRHTKFKDLTAYKAINIRDIPKYISPNSSIGSENWDNAVVGAIVNPTDVESPMEVLLMGD